MWCCSKCGKAITVEENFPGGYYARCNTCCSMDNKNRDYVYAYLSTYKQGAINQMVRDGLVEWVPNELYRKKQISEEPTVDSVFGRFYRVEGTEVRNMRNINGQEIQYASQVQR